MIERPILFKDEMVRQIIAGRKTQTRRVVTNINSYFDGGPWYKHLKPRELWDWDNAHADGGPSPAGNGGPYLHLPYIGPDDEWGLEGTSHRIYSRMDSGDHYWVKECFYHWSIGGGAGVYWRATDPEFDGPWTTSLFMKRIYSRLDLDIKKIRLERVDVITDEDALAEGCPPDWEKSYDSPRAWFAILWDQINFSRGLGWAVNPWVWATTFTKVDEDG